VSSAPPLVVFVAPFLAETTLRFVGAVTALDGVRLAVVGQEGPDRLPPSVRRRVAAYVPVDDALDPERLTAAVADLARAAGSPQRLLGALEQLQVPLAVVRERLGIEGMGVEAATNFRDKGRMKDVLRGAGVPCARHALAGSPDEARAAARRLGFPLVVKPPAGAAARNTFRVEDAGGLEQVLAGEPPRPDRPMLLEEFVRGDEHSFDAVTVRGRPVWHSLTHYAPGPLEVLENPWIQWTVLLPREVDHPRYDDVRAVAARALGALGADTGLSHMEWFRRADGSIAVSEIAARPPGAQFTTLISWAHDVDFYRAWARLVVFERFDPPPRRYAAGIAFLRGQGRGTVRAIHGLDRAQVELGPLVVEVRLPRAGQAPGGGYEGDGWVVLRHPDTATVAAALRRLVSIVRVELA